MKYQNDHFLLAFILFSSIFHFIKSEYYTAMAELEKLLHTEEEIVKNLKTYIKFEEQRLVKVKWLSNQYEMLQTVANNDTENFLSNPVNAYLLVKRLTIDWEIINLLIHSYDGQAVMENVATYELNFPNKEDLYGAAAALIRLQETYLLDTAAIAKGQIKGTSLSTELTAGDCFELGRHAYESFYYNQSLLWMQESLKRLHIETIKTASQAEILEYMAYASYSMNNFTAAISFAENLLLLDPYHPRALNDLDFYENAKLNYENKKKNGSFRESELDEDSTDPLVEVLDPKIIEEYEKLCRGETVKTPKEESKLHCYYDTNNNGLLLLQPVKIEVLNLKPRIVMYYDVLNDKEAEVIKSLSLPRLARATVSNHTTGGEQVASYRISKSTWLYDFEHECIPKINQRIEAITGLSTEISEPLHVINYGIGGHYEAHFDFAGPGDKISFLEDSGNRIATWIIYLSDVLAGGSTVFPSVGVEVKPVKGAAAFWYNLFKNGDGDEATRHAACPVLAGSKWVANKWLHEMGNELKRPCSLNRYE